jgi:ketosteroid isomerase-like protein
MDHASAQNWLDRYVAAWLTYDPDKIADLFSDDISYRYHPNDDPILSREAVVASWLGESPESDASTRDEPGTYRATYAPVAVDGDVVVATGSTEYLSGPGGAVEKVYDNCFVMRFDGEGRCREFTEYYIERT